MLKQITKIVNGILTFPLKIAIWINANSFKFGIENRDIIKKLFHNLTIYVQIFINLVSLYYVFKGFVLLENSVSIRYGFFSITIFRIFLLVIFSNIFLIIYFPTMEYYKQKI